MIQMGVTPIKQINYFPMPPIAYKKPAPLTLNNIQDLTFLNQTININLNNSFQELNEALANQEFIIPKDKIINEYPKATRFATEFLTAEQKDINSLPNTSNQELRHFIQFLSSIKRSMDLSLKFDCDMPLDYKEREFLVDMTFQIAEEIVKKIFNPKNILNQNEKLITLDLSSQDLKLIDALIGDTGFRIKTKLSGEEDDGIIPHKHIVNLLKDKIELLDDESKINKGMVNLYEDYYAKVNIDRKNKKLIFETKYIDEENTISERFTRFKEDFEGLLPGIFCEGDELKIGKVKSIAQRNEITPASTLILKNLFKAYSNLISP